MALSPDSHNEAFVREVDEQYRRDRMENFARTYGKWIAAALILFLAAVGGWLYWQNREAERTAAETEELQRAFAEVSENRIESGRKRLDTLQQSRSETVRALALLTGAAVSLQTNDRAEAIAQYRRLADDSAIADPFRNIALIRLTAVEFDSLKPEEVVTRLEPLAQPGEPWFGSAGELVALARIRQGRQKEAGQLFARIAADRQVPESLRSRAVQIASTLGVDASASLPALQQ